MASVFRIKVRCGIRFVKAVLIFITHTDPDGAPDGGACSSETLGLAYKTTWRHNPDDQGLNITFLSCKSTEKEKNKM